MPAATAAPTPPPSQDLDNPLEPLKTQKPRTEGEDDRITSLALFATARTLEQRHDLEQALRHYQRALRYDPQSLPALRELVPLAFSLNRPDEAPPLRRQVRRTKPPRTGTAPLHGRLHGRIRRLERRNQTL